LPVSGLTFGHFAGVRSDIRTFFDLGALSAA
jgi:hypothetical protein